MGKRFEEPVEIENGHLSFSGTNKLPPTGKTGKIHVWYDTAGKRLMSLKDGASTSYEHPDSTYVWPIAQLDLQSVQVAQVTITSAQLLALHTTSIALVAAPGAGLVLQFLGALITYVYGTTVYTINSSTNLAVQYTNASGATASSTLATTGFIDQASNQVQLLSPVASTVAVVANAALVLTLAGANPTLGDGTLSVRTLYRVLATP